MLEKLPDAVGHALRGQRAGLDKTAFQAVDLRAGMAAIAVASLAFVDHAPIPARYTADGPGLSPPLQWIGVPPDAASLLLIVEDADAPTPQPLVHAIVVGLDGADGALAEGALPSDGNEGSGLHVGRYSWHRSRRRPVAQRHGGQRTGRDRHRRPEPSLRLVRPFRLPGHRARLRRGRHRPLRDDPACRCAVSGELVLLAPGVQVWLAEQPGHGHANAGVVVEAQGITVLDALAVPSQWDAFGAAVDAIGLPIRQVVLSSSNAEFSGGTARFRNAAVYGRPQASTYLDQPADPAILAALYPRIAAEFTDEWATRPVTHIVDAPVQLTPAVALHPFRGQQEQNLVAHLAGAAVVFAGALCSFGVTPMAHQGDPAAWADALDALLALAPIIVPGHGPIGGEEEVRELQAYLRAVVAAGGEPDRLAPGPWDGWADAEWHPINVERAGMLARGDDGVPPTLLRRLGL